MDTKSLVQWGIAVIGGVMGVTVVMLGVIAVVHDGEVATTIVQQFIGVVAWGMPVLGGLLGINQVASALVSIKQASAGATVAVAQATTPAAAPVIDNGPSNG